jgi:serine phosphatase RsbU (regulator of sigma subunit)
MQVIKQRQTISDELLNAKRIQQGLLPKQRHFDRIFEKSFVLYLPQNAISGDFYWVGQKNEMKYLVVGDCTGHGVSAALLSVLAINLFEYTIMNKGIKKTDKILREVDKKFIESFKDDNFDNYDNPWIDLSLLCFDTLKKKVYFSGANRKMLQIKKNGERIIYNGNRYPIGGWQLENKRAFTPKITSFEVGDKFYIGSDGFQDQIGGRKNKKYRSKNLHDYLVLNHKKSFKVQQNRLQKEFAYWKGDNEQIDDVCIVGVEI